MKHLYTQENFEQAKVTDLLPVQCETCNRFYSISKKRLYGILNPKVTRETGQYCSKECRKKGQNVTCKNCNTVFYKTASEIKKCPNHFCSCSCAATYNNTHKKHGTRRSKLEVWIEEQLIVLYPELEIHFNRKDTINSELDIYIPSLSLAIELNGIFHYEPIYGKDKLSKIENNDDRKFQACLERNIELCIIDTSNQSYVTPKTSQRFLDIVCSVVNKKLMISRA